MTERMGTGDIDQMLGWAAMEECDGCKRLEEQFTKQLMALEQQLKAWSDHYSLSWERWVVSNKVIAECYGSLSDLPARPPPPLPPLPFSLEGDEDSDDEGWGSL